MVILTVLLPVIWALISTVIALALYKTSKALFVTDTVRNAQAATMRRRLSLAGSVVIASVAFAGMKYATPNESLRLEPKQRVSEAQAHACVRVFDRLKTALSLPATSDDLVQAVRSYISDCEPVIRELAE